MPFSARLHALFEQYTTNPPRLEDGWYGPWNALLNYLFPFEEGYMISPHRRLPDNSDSQPSDIPIPDLIIEVLKGTAPSDARTVLIVEIKSHNCWESGIPSLPTQINLDAAFASNAHSRVYWMEAIGPHWRYGKREDEEQDLQTLSDWHDTAHDQASFEDFQTLKSLIAAL